MAISVKVTGIPETLAQSDAELIEFANQTMRLQIFQTLGDLKAATPVDTGRARNSWIATQNPTSFRNSLQAGGSSGLLSTPSKEKLEQYYITNGVPYIADLNAGSSRQAPARFVEKTIMKRFTIDGLVYVTL